MVQNVSYAGSIIMPPESALTASSYLSDTEDLPGGVRSVWVSVAGNVKVDYVGGGTVTYSNVPVGRLSGFFQRIYSTGTTATVENLEF